MRAFRLEEALGCEGEDIKIYFKNEAYSPTGSHKANTALAQAYYAKKQGLEGLCTETGAGQWGSAISMAGAFVGLKIKVWQVRISYDQKPGRRVFMHSFCADLYPSPSDQTETGRKYLAQDPNNPGSLGIAISEAVEASMASDKYRYSLGSVVDFVCLHQTIIGQEAKIQMEMVDDYPDVVIGCIGGGSNFAGLALPFAKDKLLGEKPNLEIIGSEPTACPSLTKGKYTWDFGDSAKMAPIVKMYTLGHTFIPPPVHAGGLRYHGASPLVSNLTHNGVMKTEMWHQTKIIEDGFLFAKSEGILPAPETCHAISSAVEAAKAAKANGEKKTILFNFSGHGFFDIAAYKAYMDHGLEEYEYPDAKIQEALKDTPQVNEEELMKMLQG